MVYKYYNLYMENMSKPPKTDYRDGLQEFVNDQFYNSSDWHTIQEETSFASGEYEDLDVRINDVVSTTTGANRGDDWKRLLFKDIVKSVDVGAMFYFDSNYWVTVNTENLSTLTSECTLRRCNNTLRWIDDAGARHSIPCVLDYVIGENRNYATGGSKLVNPSGLLEVITQLNDTTNLIKANERFLFGNPSNWTSYVIQGGGINNFSSTLTESLAVKGILKLTTGVVQLNEDVDDLVNGYANDGELSYTVSLDKSSISGQATDIFQLEASAFLNGETVSRSFDWVSDDTSIATVSAGLVTMVATGTATVTASLDGDETVYATCSITVGGTPISEKVVTVTPETNYVLEGDTDTFLVYLELNGAVQADVFTFAIVSGTVPTVNYILTSIDGNSFSVENVEKFASESLVVRATSGLNIKDIEFLLKGVY